MKKLYIILLSVMLLAVIAKLSFTIQYQQILIDRYEIRLDLYINQMTPLQKAMNGITCTEVEESEYLNYIWNNWEGAYKSKSK